MGLFDQARAFFKSGEKVPPQARPGRNDLCWCGSGKKYKKCHLPQEEERAAEKACGLNCGPT